MIEIGVSIGMIVLVSVIAILIKRFKRNREMNKSVDAIIAKQEIIKEIEETNEQETLFKMFIKAKDSEIEKRILKKISEETILLDIIKSNKREKLKLLALKKIKNDDILEELSKKSADYKIRIFAIDHLKNQELLEEIVLTDSNQSIQEIAAKRIKDKRILSRIVGSTSSEIIKNIATEKLEKFDGNYGKVTVNNEKNKVIEENVDIVVLCCPNSNCLGRISSSDSNLKIHLKQLAIGGMVSGTGITCMDCGVNSPLSDWHNKTVEIYGNDYLEKGNEIINK